MRVFWIDNRAVCPYERLRDGDLECRWLRDWYPRRSAACRPDRCPAGTGPWGAWRSMSATVSPMLALQARVKADPTLFDEVADAWFDLRSQLGEEVWERLLWEEGIR